MATSKPHYLLFCDGCLLPSGALHTEARGRWRFVLEDIVTGVKTEASDCESSDHVDRVALLGVMRGLEALEQPSRVTLVTTSRYVARGLQYGLVEWRENDYCWEHFGSTQPIRNADLWRRVDVALRFHEVQCRWMSQESPARDESTAVVASIESPLQLSAVRISEAADEMIPDAPLAGASPEVAMSAIEGSHAQPSAAQLIPLQADPVVPFSLAVAEREVMPSSQDIARLRPDSDSVHGRVAGRRLLNTQATRPIRWIWNTILAMDAFIVSCLRCLFLLDPRREHFRRRNY